MKVITLDHGIHTFKAEGLITITVRATGTSLQWDNDAKCEYDILPNLFDAGRYYCSCDPKIMNDDQARFARQVVIELPDSSRDKARRLKQGLAPTVCIDPCIVDAMKELWSHGIETLGCCCGHNVMRAWVNVDEKDYVRMFELGYVQRPVEVPKPGIVQGLYTFFL